MFRYPKIAILIGALATAGVGVVAYADSVNGNEVIAFTAAKVSLTQAVATAETLVGGKAHSAEFGRTKVLVGTVVTRVYAYKIEVLVAGTRMFEVAVDPNTGAVVSSVEELPGTDKDD